MEIYSTETFEKLKIRPVDVNSMSSSGKYHYFPKNKKELKEILLYLIKERGNNGTFNDIDTSTLTDMSYLFRFMVDFNGDISEWNVSCVTDMNGMFMECEAFNCSLNNWNITNVETMEQMFWSCSIFNKPLNNWNVHNVKNMNYMFQNCARFNQDLSSWDVKGKEHDDMFDLCPISTKYMPRNIWR